jgi:FtsP/CotA-like multicopper oxidase with cupredoxin domain
LTLNLFAEWSLWHPGPKEAPPVQTLLFGEEGRAPSNPGPLARVPLGTRIELSFRNAYHDTLQLSAMCVMPCAKGNRVRVAPGATGRLSFTPRHAGTFVYWGAPVRHGHVEPSLDKASQLAGVIVVDSGPSRPDRIITVSTYAHPKIGADQTSDFRLIFAFNGRVWPYTDRFHYNVGDSVRWRVVNLGDGEHPLHLHGFYFRVERRGDGAVDHALRVGEQPLVVTEEVGPLGTFEMVWSPERAGNWLFHCHKPAHITNEILDGVYDRNSDTTHHVMPMSDDHALSGMSGLVLGISVASASGVRAAGDARAPLSKLRLVAQQTGQKLGDLEMLGYTLARGDSASPSAKPTGPGPTLFVTRGEPTQITVVNHLADPTAVHWHGIELESFYDGVAGWSGEGSRVAPLIAPRDSFAARFTAPRAGTFIYHTHVDDLNQLVGGLYGALVVLEPGERWNDTTDHIFAVGQAPDWTVLNGSPSPPSLRLKAGVAHRLRFLSMTIDDETDVSIMRNDSVMKWKPLAKDAIPVPIAQRTLRPARLHYGPGETYDFEFTPARGQYEMKVSAYTNVLLTIVAR